MANLPKVSVNTSYKEKYGFSKPEKYVFKSRKGLSEDIVKEISSIKQEPEWMLEFRLKSYEIFKKKKGNLIEQSICQHMVLKEMKY